MLTALIHLLLILVVLIVVYYIVRVAAGHFGLPPVVVQLIGLILALVFLLYAIRLFGLIGLT